MVLRTVTTVWCTGLGTTLLIGFESTTVIPAYFRCQSPFSFTRPPGQAKFLFRWSRHAGAPLLRNSPVLPRLWNWTELESERLCLGPEFGLLMLFVAELGGSKPAVIELLSGRNEMEDDPR
jgi:hypothetical protein